MVDCGDCLAKCSAKLVIIVSATLYLLLGVGTTIGFSASLFSVYGALLPFSVSGLGLLAGLLITAISTTGYCAACSKYRPWGWLVVFTLFTFALLVGAIFATAYLLNSATVLSAVASFESSTGMSGTEATAVQATRDFSAALAATFTAAFDACAANVTVLSAANATFHLGCRDEALEPIATLINEACLGPMHPVLDTTNSTFSVCESDDSGIWPNTTASVLAAPAAARFATARGIFCQCESALASTALGYVHMAVLPALLCDVYFSLVLFAGCYLLCCAAYGERVRDDDIELNRERPATTPRPRSAVVERMRAKYGAGGEQAAERSQSFLAAR